MTSPSAILLGSKPGSVVALSVLLTRGWRVPAVVISAAYTYPWIAGPTLRDAADEAGIPVIENQSELILQEPVDFVISYMHRSRVPQPVLGLARRAAVNFHPAPLPESAGWAFYNLAILENAGEYGCSCHHMTHDFDAGPLVKVRCFPIDASAETAWSLEQKAQEEMVRLFIDFCDLAESGAAIPSTPQDPEKMRYLTREKFEALKQVPKYADAETIDRRARAFWYPPYECAYFAAGGRRFEIIPASEKGGIAAHLHARDLENLRRVAAEYSPEPVHAGHHEGH